MYPRNASSPPRIAVGAVVQISDGAVQTSGVSIKVIPQGGSASAGGGTTAYEEGIVLYTPTQAETDHVAFVVVAYKSGCIPASQTVITQQCLPDAAPGEEGGLPILGNNTGRISFSDGMDITASNDTALSIAGTDDGDGLAISGDSRAIVVQSGNAAEPAVLVVAAGVAVRVESAGGDAVQLASTGGNGDAISLTGQGSGHAVHLIPGATGRAIGYTSSNDPLADGIAAQIAETTLESLVTSNTTAREALARIDIPSSSIGGGAAPTVEEIVEGVLEAQVDSETTVRDALERLDVEVSSVGIGMVPSAEEVAQAVLDATVDSDTTVRDALERIDVPVSTVSGGGGGSGPSASEIAGAVWDEALSGHTTAGSAGKALADALADTSELQQDWANGGRLDNILDARASQASVDDIPTNSELTAALSSLATASALSTVASNVNGIKAKTDLIPAGGFPANFSSLSINASGQVVLPATQHTSIADAVLTRQMTESYRANGAAPTLAQGMCELLAHHGEAENAGNEKTIRKLDHTSQAMKFEYELDSDGQPISIKRVA